MLSRSPDRSDDGAIGSRRPDPGLAGDTFADDPGSGPVALDITVDAALVLRSEAGIDEYPAVLALLPNIFRPEDQAKVHAVVLEELTRAGVVSDDRVHPSVQNWLRCLDRPDMELAARISDTGFDSRPRAMLRFSLVRRGETHVLALRCGDRVVVQPLFHQGRQLDTVTAALSAALGPCRALALESFSATFEQLDAVPADPEERRRALLALGATAHTATVLTRTLDEVVRRAEVVVIEHHDGRVPNPDFSMSVLDTSLGRIVVAPRRAMDTERWSTFSRGDDAALGAGIAALIELLPGRSWFDTVRTE